MKLNSAQVERALKQFEAQALPEDHPVVPQLASMFGEHTFFLDSGGLNVLEPTEASSQEAPVGIPERFTLVIEADHIHVPCRVVWRKEKRIGVHFET